MGELLSWLQKNPSIVAALVAAAVTVAINFFGKIYVDHRMETLKSDLARSKAENDAKIEYELEARKRLYGAIGNLRFQLLLAARDVANQVTSYGRGRQFDLTTTNYFGQSTLHKLVMPFAFCELIEKQISYADFSVDPEAVDLLRLKRSVYTAFCSGASILNHPDANWEDEEQHVFRHSLDRISNSLLTPDSSQSLFPMPFHEFEKFVPIEKNAAKLSPLPYLMHDFSIDRKPQFWIRLVLYGYLCSKFVNEKGQPVGFNKIDFPLGELIGKVNDKYFLSKKAELVKQFEEIAESGI
ncbi:MAG: hypothetical protein AAFQ10_10615 [Pseudomonadota bacterium]